ncbi:glycosyltransferase family 4 protein [Thiocystis violacea]|uniref:glycosyltransferase family 4 protein n=1 Tax=Thiocystis violacea TaxID=13725 RepID=UPI001906C3B5|nr:glycosyltransferase family 4 protein [Thiocystis violacea]MBK1718328.1 hypothetical protein [Thiocystis violacea]
MLAKTIAFPHRPPPIGGPGTFQILLESEVAERGWKISYAEDKVKADVVFVVGGTVKLAWLMRQKYAGAKIVHRLDGLNWRPWQQSSPLRTRTMASIRNVLMRTIRDLFADYVIYQSEFIKDWWRSYYGLSNKMESVIYNGTNLSVFRQQTVHIDDFDLRIGCVEGTIEEDGATLETIIGIASRAKAEGQKWRIDLYGSAGGELSRAVQGLDNVHLHGKFPRDRMPAIYNSCNLFLVLEINPPCPNSVVEALASGLPVIGYDTGALSEMLTPNGGLVVPYGSNPWRLESPNVSGLYDGIMDMAKDLNSRSLSARRLAEEKFDAKLMLQRYMDVIEGI